MYFRQTLESIVLSSEITSNTIDPIDLESETVSLSFSINEVRDVAYVQ